VLAYHKQIEIAQHLSENGFYLASFRGGQRKRRPDGADARAKFTDCRRLTIVDHVGCEPYRQ
jgi:hypothetical protein